VSTPTDSDLDDRIAVFRHGLISRLLPKDLSAEQRRNERRRIVAAEHQIPGTTRTHVAEGTLREWMRAWHRGGFDALKPKRRADEGAARALAPPLAERLLELKEAEPTRPIRECIALARAEGLSRPTRPSPTRPSIVCSSVTGSTAATTRAPRTSASIVAASPSATRDSCG